MTEPIDEYYYLKPIEPDNQTKVMNNKQEDAERRKRHEIAKRILSDGDEEYKTNCICTLLEAQSELAKERELRKELVEQLQLILNVFREDMLKVDIQHYESLIKKS